jgi:hypothetical protein
LCSVFQNMKPDVLAYLWQYPVFKILVSEYLRFRAFATWSTFTGWLLPDISRQCHGLIWTFKPWRWDHYGLETSSTNHRVTRCHVPEEGRPQLHRCESVKIRIWICDSAHPRSIMSRAREQALQHRSKKEQITLAAYLVQKLKDSDELEVRTCVAARSVRPRAHQQSRQIWLTNSKMLQRQAGRPICLA